MVSFDNFCDVCLIIFVVVFNVQCVDNGMLGDFMDDLIIFFILVDGVSIVGSYIILVFGQAVQFFIGMFGSFGSFFFLLGSVGSGFVIFILIDVLDSNCIIIVQLSDFGICLDVCVINVFVMEIICIFIGVLEDGFFQVII